MGKADKTGKYPVQIRIEKDLYEKLRRYAFEMDKTVNKTIVFILEQRLRN